MKFEANKINRLLSTTDSFYKKHARKCQHTYLLSQSRWNIYNYTFHSTAMLSKATHKPIPFKMKALPLQNNLSQNILSNLLRNIEARLSSPPEVYNIYLYTQAWMS